MMDAREKSIEKMGRLLYAANQNDVNAQYQCGELYYRGERAEYNGKEVLKWYQKAAEVGC